MTLPRVQLFLLNHERPVMGREALEACLAQDYPNLEVILSDNSPKMPIDLTGLDQTSLHVVKRANLNGEAHHNIILSEAAGDYFVLAHDDDVLEPFFISKLVAAAEANPECSIVVANANLMIESRPTLELYNRLRQPLFLKNGRDLFQRYLRFDLGSSPFPATLYRTKHASTMRAFFELGKYSDTMFIEQMLSWGPILYLSEPLMKYRRHGANDSVVIDIRQAKKLVNYVVHRGYYLSSREFDPMSFRIWMIILRARSESRRDRKYRLLGVAAKFILSHPVYYLRFAVNRVLSHTKRRLSPVSF